MNGVVLELVWHARYKHSTNLDVALSKVQIGAALFCAQIISETGMLMRAVRMGWVRSFLDTKTRTWSATPMSLVHSTWVEDIR